MAAVLTLNYMGTDSWNRPVYRDQHGRFWKDVDLGSRATPSLYSSSKFEGEPGYPLNAEYVITKRYERGKTQ